MVVLFCGMSALLAVFASDSRRDSVGWRVAVIGAGIGGSSVAYNLRGVEGLSVDVFEAGDVGGRAHEFQYEGQVFEVGASIIWDRNIYLAQAANELNLTVKWMSDKETGDDSFLIWDGKQFVFQMASSWTAFAKLLLRYGPAVQQYAKHVGAMWQNQFRSIYALQASNVSFVSPEDLLKRVGLFDYTQTTAEEHIKSFLSSWWIWGATTFRNELAAAINRVNYNQRNSQMNAFAGLISFAPASGGRLWAVEGGNSRLATSMLAASGALLLTGSRVARIETSDDGRIIVRANTNGVTADYGAYDAVVVATPLELASISLDGIKAARLPPRKFTTTVTTFVRGNLQASYFGVSKLASQTIMLSETAEAEFSSISDFDVNGTTIYKVFSSAALPLDTVQRLFGVNATVLLAREWAAYPAFSPPEQFSPFVLAPGLFYNNAIENAASAMEMSAIAARNSALLVLEHLARKARPAQADGGKAGGADTAAEGGTSNAAGRTAAQAHVEAGTQRNGESVLITGHGDETGGLAGFAAGLVDDVGPPGAACEGQSECIVDEPPGGLAQAGGARDSGEAAAAAAQ